MQSESNTTAQVGSLDADRCYRALRTRDPRFDGRFFTGVRSTGIYCRPICPARTPKRANVVFYPCAAAAEAAGFRACLRCRPESAPGTPAWAGTSAVVNRALRLIEDGALDRCDVDELAAKLGLGARQLRRLFEQHVGVSPSSVARKRRVHFARRLIDETDLPMTRVAEAAGFKSVRQFNHAMRQSFERAPSALREHRARRTPNDRDHLVLKLPYRAPYHWKAMLAFLALRATPGVESVHEGRYARTHVTSQGSPIWIELGPAPDGSAHAELVVRGQGSGDLLDVADRARRLLDLVADPGAIDASLAADPALAELVEARPGLRVPGAWDGFELAVRAVLGQQVTLRGATTLTGRLVERFGHAIPHRESDDDAPTLTHLFPGPEALADADLAAIGLPAARADTLRGLARAAASGELALRCEDGHDLEASVEALCALPGIGPWTAHYVAMRALREPDAFPSGDLVLRKSLTQRCTPGQPPMSARALEERSAAWSPWRAYAALHLWNAAG